MYLKNDNNQKVTIDVMKKELQWHVAYHQKEINTFKSRLNALNKVTIIE